MLLSVHNCIHQVTPRVFSWECCNISQHSFFFWTHLAASVFTTSMAFPRMLESCSISHHSLTPLAATVFTTSMAMDVGGLQHLSALFSFDSFGCCSVHHKHGFPMDVGVLQQHLLALLSFDSFGCCSIRCKHGFPMDVGGLQQHLSALF